MISLLSSGRSCYNQAVLKPISLPWTRWLILGSVVGLLLVTAPEPNDTVALTSFQRGTKLAADGLVELLWPRTRSPLLARLTCLASCAVLGSSAEAAGPSIDEGGAAEEAYSRTIARRPRDPQPWRQLGNLYVAWGRPDDALHAYNQAVRRGDDRGASDPSLAQLYADLGDYRQSVRHWENHLVRRPDDRAARLTLAQTAIRLADWERARTELEYLLSSDPDDPVARAWLGLLLIGPDPVVGMPHLQRAAQDPTIATFLAPVFAAERLSVARDDPAYRSALLGVAFLTLDTPALFAERLMRPGQASAAEPAQVTATLALRSLLAAIYRNPAYADAYAYLGQAFDQLGWPAWARASLAHALQLAPQSPVALTLSGLYWDRHGQPALARQYYQAAYDQDQHNAALCLEIASTYAAEGQYTAAEIWLLIAAQLAPHDSQVWETLSHFYLDSGIGVEESGLPAANRLLELAPDDAHAHDLLGWAYFLTQEDAQAEASLRHALTLDPTLASAHYHLGRLYARQGRYAAAAQAYRRARDYDLGNRLAMELERAWQELPPAYRGGS
jgi:tetratricopeptide (TPR) repeat protein